MRCLDIYVLDIANFSSVRCGLLSLEHIVNTYIAGTSLKKVPDASVKLSL